MSSKYGDLIRQARKTENQKDKKPDDQITSKPDKPAEQISQSSSQESLPALDATEQEVNLCVKVPISLRRHWSAEAKRQGVTMTSVIIEALKTRFGEPPSH
ncbi:hypothetical protein HC931_22395 [Candidatus Gracilibacteria bacterium]|nr:hypothetical protein [Candidatus Gracilibacteria bacterium]NJM89274.1 hypothetical protein [Hydrococcus sp. RU_2_2]NJP21067.1 hypothetical protein [Hydrococcus sp. CRU_1_1]NJQ96581.1 hypothetical protein [Hydrococcus sp. CSU_1_8]